MFISCLLYIVFFIVQHQARRVYEILRLRYTDTSDTNMYRDFRIDVKKRLNIPYQVFVFFYLFAFIYLAWIMC